MKRIVVKQHSIVLMLLCLLLCDSSCALPGGWLNRALSGNWELTGSDKMTYSITNVNGRDLKAGVGEPVLGSGVLTLRNHNYSIRLDLEGDTPWTGFEQSGEVRITRAGWLYWYTGAGILIPDQGPQKDFSFNYRNKILTMTIEGYQFRFEKRQ